MIENKSKAPAMTADDIKSAAEALAPEIERRGDEIAALRHLPPDLVVSLKRAGAFRMLMPRAWGGPEMSPREQCEVIEIYSRADPSVGWCVMIGSDSGFFAGYLQEDAARELYAYLDFSFAGSANPLGRAVRVPGGFKISGRWTFGSNIDNAEIVTAICPVFEGDTPIMVNGFPQLRMFAAPAASYRIIDTWHTTGLAGTGSKDYEAEDLFVPESHTVAGFPNAVPVRSEPLYSWVGIILANMNGVPLGLARRAIETVKTLAVQKRQPNPTRLHESLLLKELPRVRANIARAEASLGAARAYAYEALDRLWDDLRRERRPSKETRVALGCSRLFCFRSAREIAQMMVDTVGTSAIYQTSPLDRLLRDAITMCQHWTAQERTYELVGALALGDELPGLI